MPESKAGTIVQIPDPNNIHNLIIGELDDPEIKRVIWDMARRLAVARLIGTHMDELNRMENEELKKLIGRFSIAEE